MNIQERRQFILDRMVADGMVKVADIAEAAGVTQTTIRKDLTELESKGLLYRAYGTALPTADQVMDISMNTKKLINYDPKQKIAVAAAKLIESNDSIIISSGSTTAVFADQIKPKGRLNVVSTSVSISAKLGEIPGITVMQVGGTLYSNTLSTVGIEAARSLQNVHCAKAFVGVEGFDPEFGITCGTVEEAELTQQMIQSSSRLIVLSDSTKYGQKGFGRICGMELIDILITDSRLDESVRKEIEALGVKVIIV